ncbi:MAG: DUF4157 domain-containing protein [Richelia sp. SM1_7_0]|nr:DUF4157 domain-containing protein [Richelia sp. SM1_7_0]
MQSGEGTVPRPKPEELEVQIQKKCSECKSEEKHEQENVPVQTKLTVGQPGDKYEQEADNMAAQVMAMSDSAIQHRKEEDTELVQPSGLVKSITKQVQRQIQNKDKIQTKAGLQRSANGNLQASLTLESSLANSQGSGSQFPDSVRAFMEPRFGADFSAVRVHTDSNAVQMNKELGAAAFTHGNDIYYGQGQSPGNNELTAHELTHTIQQTGGLGLNKQVRRQTQKESESIAAKQLSISTSELPDNKEFRQKPATSELEPTEESLQAKQLSNYASLENKSFIQPLLLSSVNPCIQATKARIFELKTHPSLWKAVQAFSEDPEKYNGIEHLTAAQENCF